MISITTSKLIILQTQEPIAVANFVIDTAEKIIYLSQIFNFKKFYSFYKDLQRSASQKAWDFNPDVVHSM